MGTGTARYEDKRYYLDLKVTSVKHKADEAKWKRAFEWTSKLLFDATLGQMQLGKISFLNEGSENEIDDVFLLDKVNTSQQQTGSGKPGTPFYGKLMLGTQAMIEPAIIVHEIGHYIADLADEYSGKEKRTCQADPTTHECIMEYARSYGPVLTDSPSGNGVYIPKTTVDQFCYKNHVTDSSNPQQTAHNCSCLQTFPKFYKHFQLRDAITSPQTNLKDLTWTTLPNVTKHFFIIPDSNQFKDEKVATAARSAIKTWFDLVKGTQDQVGIMLGSDHNSQIPAMETTEEILPEVFRRIDQLNFSEPTPYSNITERVINVLGLSTAAYRRGVFMGASDLELSDDFADALTVFAEKQIQFDAALFGRGLFSNVIDTMNQQEPWLRKHYLIEHLEDSDFKAGLLLNDLVQRFFRHNPGFGIVMQDLSRLGTEGNRLLSDGGREIEIPVFIESSAQNVTFVISSLSSGAFDFRLVSPNGKVVNDDLPNVRKSSKGQIVDWYQVTEPTAGTWKMLVTPRGGPQRDEEGRPVPFAAFAAAKNGVISSEASVIKTGNGVTFENRTSHVLPLRNISSKVSIYALNPGARSVAAPTITIDLETRPTDPDRSLYRRTVQLEPGNYEAIFHVENAGDAMAATTHLCSVEMEFFDESEFSVPEFTRISRVRFRVE